MSVHRSGEIGAMWTSPRRIGSDGRGHATARCPSSCGTGASGPATSTAARPTAPAPRELMLVVSGSVVLVVGDTEHRLAAGDSASYVGDVAHSYRNTSATRAGPVHPDRLRAPTHPGRLMTDPTELADCTRSWPPPRSTTPCWRCVRTTARSCSWSPVSVAARATRPATPRSAGQRRARASRLAGAPPESLPEVAAWREAFLGFGVKPRQARSSVEALVRRVDAGLPRIDRLTDLYNAVSVEHLRPGRRRGPRSLRRPARLVRAVGDESFDTVADGEPTTVTAEPGRGRVARRPRRHLPPVELAPVRAHPARRVDDEHPVHP